MGFRDTLKRFFAPSLERGEEQSLRKFQQLIGYQFRDESLLRTSLTHRSYSHSKGTDKSCNERLEFLGDSVLGLLIAEQLYRDHPEMQEGQLTQTKALLVNESTLADIGRNIKLNNYVRLASEEERSGGRDRPSIIADAFESIIGAVFLDGGLGVARDLVLRLIYTHREEIISDASRQNFKGELLELIQGRGNGLPHYDVVSEEGPDHEKVFCVEVYINGAKYGTGCGLSKKEAEQKAAAMALERYMNFPE
jgi:ribonuclease-3